MGRVETQPSPETDTDIRFTNYIYDPVIGKYFAQARFYDSANGRMQMAVSENFIGLAADTLGILF